MTAFILVSVFARTKHSFSTNFFQPFWADMFDEEVEIEPLGPPCPKLLEDVVRGERRLRLTLKRSHRQMCCTIVDDVARHVHCFLSTNFQYLANVFGNEKTKHRKSHVSIEYTFSSYNAQ